MKKIVGIKGSPRTSSNSYNLLSAALNGIKSNQTGQQLEVEIIEPSRLDIHPCRACFACYEDGKCIIDDQMQPLYSLFNTADILLVSTPVFFNGIPAQLKALIDRCQAIWSSKYMAQNPVIDRDKKRYGHLFVTGGAPAYKEQFTAAERVMTMFFQVLNTDFCGQTEAANVDEQPVTENEKLLQQAHRAGINLINNSIET